MNKIPYDSKMLVIGKLVDVLYDLPGCDCGGLCHIVTDDGNVEDGHLNFVIESCDKAQDKYLEKDVAKLICQLMSKLTIDQRQELYRLFGRGIDITEGYFDSVINNTD